MLERLRARLPGAGTRYFFAPKILVLLGIAAFLILFSSLRFQYLQAEQAVQASTVLSGFFSLSKKLVAEQLENQGEPDLDAVFDTASTILTGTRTIDCVTFSAPSAAFKRHWPVKACDRPAAEGKWAPVTTVLPLASGLTIDVTAHLNEDYPAEVYAREFLVVGGVVLLTALLTFVLFNRTYHRAVIRPMKALLDDVQQSVTLDDARIGEPASALQELQELAVQYNAILERVAELRRKEVLEKILREKALEGLVLANEDQRIVDFNPAAEKIFQISRREVIGKNVEDVLVPPHHRDAHRRAWSRHLNTGERTVLDRGVFEIDALRCDGTAIDIEMRIESIESKTGSLFAAYMIDVTERKLRESELRIAMEKAEAATVAKSNFLAMMSHEVRTPLNAVLGLIGLTLDEKLEPVQRSYLEKAETSGRHLLHVINDVLDLTQIESGEMRVEDVEFDLRSVFHEVATLVGTLAEEKDISISVDVADDIPRFVRADNGLLRQVLLNLAYNALKFTEQGEVSMIASLNGPAENGTARVLFEVVDTGHGITEEDQARIFDAFSQADSGHGRRHEGSGLGLTISKRLIEAMGGRIEIESEPGQGSRFWFTLVLAVVDATPETQGLALETPETLDEGMSDGRILLVEDSPSNALVVSSILKKFGYSVDVAANGAESIVAVRDLPYDLVFMDVSMPGIDGVEATRRIRALAGDGPVRTDATDRLPIIALTANATREDRARCLDAGMDGFCAKPVTKATLLSAARKWIDGPKKSEGPTLS